MGLVRVELPESEVVEAVRRRMANGGKTRGAVVWQDRGSEVLVWAARARVRIADGYLLVKVPMASNESGRSPREVAVALFLGRPGERLGTKATTTLDLEDPSGLTSKWGEHVQAAAWGGLLDCLGLMGKKLLLRKQPLRFVGFAGGDAALVAEFALGGEK